MLEIKRWWQTDDARTARKFTGQHGHARVFVHRVLLAALDKLEGFGQDCTGLGGNRNEQWSRVAGGNPGFQELLHFRGGLRIGLAEQFVIEQHQARIVLRTNFRPVKQMQGFHALTQLEFFPGQRERLERWTDRHALGCTQI